ncbi:MAG: hypothetical protein ABI679_04235 [Gemmatimonadota bacterium]
MIAALASIIVGLAAGRAAGPTTPMASDNAAPNVAAVSVPASATGGRAA